MREVTGRDRFELHGAGRTDAGVHALAQVAHLDLATTLPPATLASRLNDALPADINILEIRPAGHRFHARRDAVARSYLYQVSTRRTAFGKPFVWWVRDPLDVDRMRDAARAFIGRHDFRAFTDADAAEVSTMVQVEEVAVAPHAHLVLLRVVGSHFLWKMVRRMTGVLVEVGRGRLDPEGAAALLGRESPLPARLTAPASGLFLERVFYPGDPREHPLRPALNI